MRTLAGEKAHGLPIRLAAIETYIVALTKKNKGKTTPDQLKQLSYGYEQIGDTINNLVETILHKKLRVEENQIQS